MDDFDMPGYTEYFYEKKAEGHLKTLKILLIFGYILFVLAFFSICYATRFIPLFAICPLLTWILVYFTWRIVSYDVYYTFDHGNMEIGKIKKRKRATMRVPHLRFDVRKAKLVAPYSSISETDELRRVKIVHDFSASLASVLSIVIVYSGERGDEAVILEKTPKLQRLLREYVPSPKV